MAHLTGRYHHRIQPRIWGGPIMVLQLEFYGERSYMNDGKRITYMGYIWKDASPDDIKNAPSNLAWECVEEKPIDNPRGPVHNVPIYPPL
jgi:hypothetical protein